jgi:hypothetical protein
MCVDFILVDSRTMEAGGVLLSNGLNSFVGIGMSLAFLQLLADWSDQKVTTPFSLFVNAS